MSKFYGKMGTADHDAYCSAPPFVTPLRPYCAQEAQRPCAPIWKDRRGASEAEDDMQRDAMRGLRVRRPGYEAGRQAGPPHRDGGSNLDIVGNFISQRPEVPPPERQSQVGYGQGHAAREAA